MKNSMKSFMKHLSRRVVALATAIGAAILMFVTLCAASSVARAENFALLPALSYISASEQTEGSQTVTSSTLFGDLKFGYMWKSGLYIGGLYHYETGSIAGGGTSTTAAAPSIGFFHGSWMAIFSYELYAQRKLAGSNITYSSGMGYQFDLAYTPAVTDTFSVGPQLTYRSTTYAKTQTGSAPAQSIKFTRVDIIPMIAMAFNF